MPLAGFEPELWVSVYLNLSHALTDSAPTAGLVWRNWSKIKDHWNKCQHLISYFVNSLKNISNKFLYKIFRAIATLWAFQHDRAFLWQWTITSKSGHNNIKERPNSFVLSSASSGILFIKFVKDRFKKINVVGFSSNKCKNF